MLQNDKICHLSSTQRSVTVKLFRALEVADMQTSLAHLSSSQLKGGAGETLKGKEKNDSTM